MALTWQYEVAHFNQGQKVIAGLDEVGRGCWAGPLVAAVFCFTTIPSELAVNDSKVLTEKARVALAHALPLLGQYAIGEVSPQEIDTLGLQAAQYLAYCRAVDSLPVRPDIVLLDGRPWRQAPFACEAIIDGDAKVPSIAAASIMAKVYRDTYMKTEIHTHYPAYGFDRHVGYGTKQHQMAIQTHGVLPIHRQSFKPIQAMV